MNLTYDRTVLMEVLASCIRRQQVRFQELISDLEHASISGRRAADFIRTIENDLRSPTAFAD